MKNKVLTTRIMAMMMVAAMTMSAAPAVYAAERADSETIKEDNQPTEETADASEEEDASEGETRTEYPLTITTYDYDGNEIETIYEKAPEKVVAVYQGSIETLLALGLEDRMTSKVGLLSGGQRQSITLLMAALKQPKLLLLDEHTAALDPKTAAKVLEISDKIIAENQLTAMMVTHNMKDAIVHGNRLIMMHEGKVIYDVAGEEKKNLQVKDLLTKFEEVSGGEFANDRMMLA